MDDEPMWAANRVVAPTPGSAITIPETANEFAIKGNHLTLVKGNQFDGGIKTDPHKHIHEFLRICDMFKYRDTKNEIVRLMMFPLSLTGRPFLHTADAVTRVKQKQLNLRVGTERMTVHIDSAMKHFYSNDDTCLSIDVIDEILEECFDALLNEGSKILYSIEGTILEEKLFAESNEYMAMTADENSESEFNTKGPPFEKITFNTDYNIKTYHEELSTDLELKPLPDNLEYTFLEEPSFLLVIISSQLSEENKNKFVSVLKRHKQSFAWKTTNIPGIFVKKKSLDTGIIYSIADSPWVRHIYCVPKKGGITVVTNEKDELVPTRTVTGWRVCIDYCKLNEATAKDHFPFPFMDQMRMPFGLCNAPATFQRCMLAIFHDIIEESIKVFMDDFFVFGNSFDKCLNNLDKMLQRCKDANLVLNWEKRHFMVNEGIVLGHKVSSVGLEVDKAKIDVISKLSPPTNVKGIRSFLGHAEFDIEIKDKKGTKNVAADHLSRIENDETSDDSDGEDDGGFRVVVTIEVVLVCGCKSRSGGEGSVSGVAVVMMTTVLEMKIILRGWRGGSGGEGGVEMACDGWPESGRKLAGKGGTAPEKYEGEEVKCVC
ncbi:reverse transcriptase domain-containing protein [Tanacetum coccineum]